MQDPSPYRHRYSFVHQATRKRLFGHSRKPVVFRCRVGFGKCGYSKDFRTATVKKICARLRYRCKRNRSSRGRLYVQISVRMFANTGRSARKDVPGCACACVYACMLQLMPRRLQRKSHECRHLEVPPPEEMTVSAPANFRVDSALSLGFRAV